MKTKQRYCSQCGSEKEFRILQGSEVAELRESSHAVLRESSHAVLKGTDENFYTQKGVYYTPGTKPKAPDWDGGKAECGYGLHFSPCVSGTLRFKADAKKFVACPVRVEDIIVTKNATYPDKIKARGVCAPVWEVDRDGKKID